MMLLAVPVRAASAYGQLCSDSKDGRCLAPRHTMTRTFIALSLAGWLAWVASLYGQSRTGTATLLVTVREQEQLQLQGENVILKIRLASGVTARLWGSRACGMPIQQAMVFTKSGTYILLQENIPHDEEGDLCLLSSDRTLRDAVAWPQVGTPTTITALTPAH